MVFNGCEASLALRFECSGVSSCPPSQELHPESSATLELGSKAGEVALMIEVLEDAEPQERPWAVYVSFSDSGQVVYAEAPNCDMTGCHVAPQHLAGGKETPVLLLLAVMIGAGLLVQRRHRRMRS
jgi:hypothetical protein